jgi:hypothetical protein
MDKPRANMDSQNSAWLGLGEATTFPIIIFYVFGHEANTQMSFCLKTPKLGVPKFMKIRTLATLEAHNFL